MQSLIKQSFGFILLMLVLSGIELFIWYYLMRSGHIDLLLENDRSRVSALILLIYALATVYFLYISYQVSQRFREIAEPSKRAISSPLLGRFFNQLPPNETDRCAAMLEVLDTRIRSSYAFGFIVADLMLKLGILGTVIGFIFMLGSLSNLNSVDITVMQTLLVEMSSGMKVALFTTLSGLIAGIALNIKYNLLDWAVDHLLNDIREIAVSRSHDS